jgi:transcriptional regulator with XRE-family HTH domain
MIGLTLKELRSRAGESQAVFANRLGLSLRQYIDLEGGATEMRELHRNAAHYLSMKLATERKDSSFLTDDALNAFLALEPYIRPEDRARADFKGVRPVLTPVEEIARQAFERALGRPLIPQEVVDFVSNMRASSAANNALMDQASEDFSGAGRRPRNSVPGETNFKA